MNHVFRLGVATATILVVAGCSEDFGAVAPVEVTRNNYVFAEDVVRAAKCEFFRGVEAVDAINQDRFVFPHAAAAFTLTARNIDRPNAALTAVNTLSQNVLAVGGGLGASLRSTKTMQLKVLFDDRDREEVEKQCPRDGSYTGKIQGDLGLAEWIGELALLAFETQEAPIFGSYKIEFGIESSGDIDGRLTELASTPGIFEFSFGKTRTVSHEMFITVDICDVQATYEKGNDCKGVVEEKLRADRERRSPNFRTTAKGAFEELNRFIDQTSD